MSIKRELDTGVSRARRYRRALGQTLAWILLAVAVFFVWPVSLGGATSFVVVSGKSMEPTYMSGDLVVARQGAPVVGDTIVYAPENLGGAQVVHRIIGGDPESGWVLQGDNNDFVDPFYPTGAEVRGIVKLHIPNVGGVTKWLMNPLMWMGVILVALVVAIWPARDEPVADLKVTRNKE